MQERVTKLEAAVTNVRSDISEIKVDIRDLRKDVAHICQQMADLRHAITRSSLTTKLWMLLIAGALLGVTARGFKWL